MASHAFLTASRRIRGSLAVNAPSLKTGRQKRFVVTIGTCMPVASRARRNRLTMSWRSVGGRAVRHEVVVVEAHAVGAEVGQAVHGVDGIEGRAHLGAEGIAARIADGPEAEGEVVLRPWREEIAHGPPVVARPERPPQLGALSQAGPDDSVIRRIVPAGGKGSMRHQCEPIHEYMVEGAQAGRT